MSLDISLYEKSDGSKCFCDCGHEHVRQRGICVFDANITHNLGQMAGEAGIYKHLWRPKEIGVTEARQLIDPLQTGIAMMKKDPERFKKHDASNGWGTYEDFMPWLERLLEACEASPDATIEVSV